MSVENVKEISVNRGVIVGTSEATDTKIKDAYDELLRMIAGRKIIYGVNTGFESMHFLVEIDKVPRSIIKPPLFLISVAAV